MTRSFWLLLPLISIAACTDSQEVPAADTSDTPIVQITNGMPDDADSQTPITIDFDKIKLGLNDVSILFPYLVHRELFTLMPEVKSFLPEGSLTKIDETLRMNDPEADQQSTFARLGDNQEFFNYRLVSARLDPCANLRERSTVDDCQGELRLVWQKVLGSKPEEFFFDDNVLHSIHALSRDQVRTVIKSLKTLKVVSRMDTLDQPLLPNPTLVKQGLDTPYFRGLLALIRRHAKPANLKGLAFFANTSKTLGNWPMLRLNFDEGVATPELIPGTNNAYVQRMFGRLELSAPTPPAEIDSKIFDAGQPAEVFASSFRLENPLLHSTQNTDCASCHRADLERSKAQKLFPNYALPSDAYRNGNWDLSAKYGIGSPLSLQMFSYFDNNVKIAPRVINTTAEICDLINSGTL